MTHEQNMCIIRTKAGAPASLWGEELPTWLMNAEFAKRYRAARASGSRFAHLLPDQQEELLQNALGDTD
jgi:hypothetical protein